MNRPALLVLFLLVSGGLLSGRDVLPERVDGSVQFSPDQVSVKDLEGTVEVSFRIDPKGKVEIIHIAATSPQLADYVIKKLNRIHLDSGDPQIGQVIKYRFVFKKQA
jgi:hypothetical protein